MYVAISAAGAFRSDDAGASWHVVTSGLNSNFLPEPEAPIRHCVHKIAMHPSRPDTVFMQKHWDVCRSDDAGDSWTEVSGNLPSDFGFPIAVHSHEPHTIFVVPIHSDSEHYPSEGKLRVFRSRSGDNEWEALTQGLPRGEGLRVRGRRRYPGGDRGALAQSVFGGGSDDPVTTVRVALSAHLRTLAQVEGELSIQVVEPPTLTSVLDALESRYPMLKGTIRDYGTDRRRAFIRFFACGRDLSHNPPDVPLPAAVSSGTDALRVVGAIAGG